MQNATNDSSDFDDIINKGVSAQNDENDAEVQNQTGDDMNRTEETWDVLAFEEPSVLAEDADQVEIIVDKTNHILELYNDGILIAEYSAGTGREDGKKQQEGDKKTPEGEYYVCTKNENSQYHLALGLSYPNEEDARNGLEDGLITEEEYQEITTAIEQEDMPNWYTALGGEIMIHG